MKKIIAALICLSLLVGAVTVHAADADGAEPVRVNIMTTEGNIVLELWPDKAPKTVENFLRYVESGHYEGTIFHRVISNFMIQAGGFDEQLHPRRAAFAPVVNEADNGLKNHTYTIAMARTSEPHSATAEFFINVQDNAPLDFRSKTPQGWGYCVFGKVYAGKNVVERIRTMPVKAQGRPPFAHVPVRPVVIKRVMVLP
ncbi:peptidyl-prolyl cis-trans isomerase B (cyclophilin B) [Paucidesulfovibrio gracilis DSM 16080]|uniref:Peptidyl-prolyl cis-trans isomerase n=1 Tax=Paucidesulfovibrio gracilis DSM 16080 TaxID=1121449 RepID=A0A1T4WZQ8_9BACT|nr:peptidylprolyl isomerase [Paucidesulfovibrio gracilis]SKA82355.1 peptidyl-prolyl cis-trans isomerase B (cyclophilin B) [Paucidesulfovibrio gracilis DSM 16080]